MHFDQELATRCCCNFRDPGFSLDGGSFEANRNCSGDVEDLRSFAQALIPVPGMGPSGFPQSRPHERCIASAIRVRSSVKFPMRRFGSRRTQPASVGGSRASTCKDSFRLVS